jgi:hypothetical protein
MEYLEWGKTLTGKVTGNDAWFQGVADGCGAKN